MAVCPVCQSEIEITSQHHGTLFTCPSCSGVFFVDWSGQPEAANPENEYSEQAFENSIENESAALEEGPAEYDFSQPLGGMPEPPMENPTELVSMDSADLSDIADFGNADLTQSAFNYTLTISGIDSGALRVQIQEALTDTKFGWNVLQIMAQIKGGVLTIRSMNPVKASIIMQRVKYLPVKVSWRQDVLSSTV